MKTSDSTRALPPCPEETRTPEIAPHELEVKLECEPGKLRKLFDVGPLSAAKLHARSQRLVGAYFDTQDDKLDGAGMTLRVRKSGTRRIMTLKWTRPQERLFFRGEVEVSVNGDAPDLERFDPEIATKVLETSDNKPLVCRFETIVRRRVADLSLGDTRVEIAFDEGEIVSADRSIKISECELELKEGDPAALFTLAAQVASAGLWLAPAPKAQRGYLLARGEKPTEVRATEPQFDPGTLVEEVIGVIIENNIRQFLGNWPALLESDLPESIHQMRVALRRLRAALRLFEKAFPGAGFEAFRAEAKRIADVLGGARDHDVFIALVTDGPLMAFASDESFEALLSASEARRLHAYEIARQVVRAPETSRFVLELQAFVASRGWRNKLGTEDLTRLGKPAHGFAADALQGLYRRARRLGKDIMGIDPEERHRLRICLKNLRYAADFFGSLFEEPRDVKKFTKTLSALQDSLGAHNDAVVALKTVRDVEQEAGGAAHRAAGIVLGWYGRESSNPEMLLKDDWRAFKNALCFWR
ncbi:CHAD domain-containing protein [Methylocystis sp. WRRC1]|uniref:CYTH and CHAD domain-containing protein n=1 Tax=Methylocystis sp. WRRC1 TaxID=1732014 RepID=UPI001D154A73|nr:CHAD domain-containing protein [Methylocystis sp. WRRC1]